MKKLSVKTLLRLFVIFLIVTLIAMPISGMAYYQASFMLAAMGTLYSGLVGFALYCFYKTACVVFLLMGVAAMFLSQLSLGFAIFYWLQNVTGMSEE
jgi:hypothetical protein